MNGFGELLYLCQDILVDVGHVPLAGHRPIVIVFKVLLQCNGIMRNIQSCVEVV